MQTYKNGREFEEAIFSPSLGRELVERFGGIKPDFSREIRKIIRSARMDGTTHPRTQIGAWLHQEVAEQLGRAGVDSRDLLFLSALDSRADISHGTDGFFFLPALDPHLVTVDAYLIDTEFLFSRREKWIDSFSGTIYSAADFQSDLFRYKTGHAEWMKLQEKKRQEQKKKGEQPQIKIEDLFSKPAEIDFRRFAVRGREENHFILTPYHIATRANRTAFARMVAGYFAAAAQENSCHKTAQQSP